MKIDSIKYFVSRRDSIDAGAVANQRGGPMGIVNQPSKEQVREWLLQRQEARSLPEMEQIRVELGWVWAASSRGTPHARRDVGACGQSVDGVENNF